MITTKSRHYNKKPDSVLLTLACYSWPSNNTCVEQKCCSSIAPKTPYDRNEKIDPNLSFRDQKQIQNINFGAFFADHIIISA